MAKMLSDTRPFARFEWMLAMRYLRSKRREGFISVISIFSFLGITLGVATLIVVMAVMNGFRTELLDKILGFGGHATIVANDRSPIAGFDDMTSRLSKIAGVRLIYMPLADAQEYFSSEEGVSAIDLTVDRPEHIAGIVPQISDVIGPSYTVTTWQQRNQTFFTALAVERNVMFLILALIILVAAFNVISGLIMLVKDKSHDIPILRTMGATRGAIQRVFFMTGAAIGITGTVAGLLIGVLFAANIAHIQKWV